MRVKKAGKLFLLPVVLVITLVLNSCAKNNVSPMDTITISPVSPSETSTPETPEPTNTSLAVVTSTPTLIPINNSNIIDSQVGLIVFAMGDGGYQHLFAFHPNLLPISRLTSGDWDDSDPAISPDGNWLVFTSNRGGQWDIYLWDLVQNTLQQLTDSPDFEASPDWSPDGQWVTFSSSHGGQSDIFIRSISDSTTAPIQLTEGGGNNIDPVWSPLGRQVAFSTNRNGHYEIWLAQLDDFENRFSVIAGNDDADYIAPAWSPDGNSLAWEKSNENSTIQRASFIEESQNNIVDLASGKKPFWSSDGKILLARLDSPNNYFLTGYDAATGLLTYPLIALPAKTSRMQWGNGNSFTNLVSILSNQKNIARTPECIPAQSVATSITGRISLVPLATVEIKDAYLSDMADECFISMQNTLKSTLGWDLLANLSSATLAVTTAPDPGIPQNWLYTGRAFSLSQAPLEAGWMVVNREDYDGLTYWRIWVRCLSQDGSCGQFISSPVWDFSSRASGDLQAFESGGKMVAAPQGYWVDITDIALQFGWLRVASQSNWRTYYPGILFNTLVFSQGKSWQQAMAELYPQEIIDDLTAGK